MLSLLFPESWKMTAISGRIYRAIGLMPSVRHELQLFWKTFYPVKKMNWKAGISISNEVSRNRTLDKPNRTLNCLMESRNGPRKKSGFVRSLRIWSIFWKNRGYGNSFPDCFPGFSIDQQDVVLQADRSNFGTWEGKICFQKRCLNQVKPVSTNTIEPKKNS